jgi:hypothetical protein
VLEPDAVTVLESYALTVLEPNAVTVLEPYAVTVLEPDAVTYSQTPSGDRISIQSTLSDSALSSSACVVTICSV